MGKALRRYAGRTWEVLEKRYCNIGIRYNDCMSQGFYLSPKQVAEQLDMPLSSVYYHLQCGNLSAERTLDRYRIRPAAVEAFAAQPLYIPRSVRAYAREKARVSV